MFASDAKDESSVCGKRLGARTGAADNGTSPPGHIPVTAAWVMIGAVVIAGAVLRLLPCFGDFWLDEIWSYYYARELRSPLEVFTGIHHSNNHHLVTLWLYFFGDLSNWAWYRIPSCVASIGSVALLGRIAWRHGRVEAVFVTVLSAFSFLLIQYASEARGYACALFFSLLAYESLHRHLASGSVRSGLAFGASIVLGILSQLIVILVYGAALLWSATHLWRKRPGGRAAVIRFSVLQTLPLGALLALYLVDLRRMEVGGGEATAWPEVLAQAIGYTFGLPVQPQLGLVYAGLVGILLLVGLWRFARQRDDSAVFLVLAIMAPVAALLVTRPDVIAPRYFIVSAGLMVLILGFELARWYRRGTGARWASIALLLMFVLGNLGHFLPFLKDGRGGYGEAMRYLAAQTTGSQIIAGFDHEFRTGIVLRFYSRFLPPDKELLVTSAEQWPAQGPEWIVTHSVVIPRPGHAQIVDRQGNQYRLETEYPYAGLSGFYWALYRNERSARVGGPPP